MTFAAWVSKVSRLFSRRASDVRRQGASSGRPISLERLEERVVLANATPLYLVNYSAVHPAIAASPNGLTASQIRQAYGVNAISLNGVVANGAGQTIAIIDAYDDPKFVDSTNPNFASSDLHQFDAAMGLPDPPSFVKVAQDGSNNYPAQNVDWDGEIALDVEWAHALAPMANILLVEANDSSLANLVNGAANYARQQPGVSVVTMSFGGGEFSGETSLDSVFTTPAGHNGVTFVASTGDNGAPGGYPALSPNVLAVGGTTLSLGGGNSYAGESAWSGSGGGLSTYESEPAYQSGVVTQTSTNRAIPDVAFDADPNSGVAVYDTVNNSVSAPWWQVGGTSLSAPAWAALISITDQLRAASGLSTLDGPTQTLPALYKLPSSDFHDVTTGGNGTYNARPGYDLVTGRGSPIANLLVPDLVGASQVSAVTPISPNPGTTMTGVSVSFANPIIPQTINASNVTVLDPNGRAVAAASLTVGASRTTLTVTFQNGQTLGGNYTLMLSGISFAAGGQMSPYTGTFVFTPNVPPVFLTTVPNTLVSANITSIANNTGPLPFTLSDSTAASSSLTVRASASIPSAVNIVVGGSGANRTVTITPALGFHGNVLITLTAMNPGTQTTTSTFTLTVDDAPVINPSLSNLTVAHTNAPYAMTVNASSPVGATLSYSAAAVSQAFVVEQQLGLIYTGNYFPNYLGFNEIWLQSTNGSNAAHGGWYFLTPDAELHQWDGGATSASVTGSPVVAAFDLSYWSNPGQLLTAVVGGAAYAAQQQLGLVFTGNYLQNALGANEKWLQSNNGSNAGNGGWYALLPSGALYAWDGSTSATSGPLVATLTPSYWNNPALLFNAVPPVSAPAGITAAFVRSSSNTLLLGGYRNFMGSFGVSVSVSDGILTTTQTFIVTVTDQTPTLQNPGPQTLASGGSVAIPLNASDPDPNETLSYVATVYTDSAASEAYAAEQTLALSSPYTIFNNAMGSNELWLKSTNGGNAAHGGWYALVPSGALYAWDGSTSATSGPLVATLDPSYWSNPSLLQTAVPTGAPVGVSITGTNNSLIVSSSGGFTGNLIVVVSLSDGILTGKTSVIVTAT